MPSCCSSPGYRARKGAGAPQKKGADRQKAAQKRVPVKAVAEQRGTPSEQLLLYARTVRSYSVSSCLLCERRTAPVKAL